MKKTDWRIVINTILEQYGWTKQELSNRTGITPQVISRLSNNPDQTPQYETGRKLRTLYDAAHSGIDLKASA